MQFTKLAYCRDQYVLLSSIGTVYMIGLHDFITYNIPTKMAEIEHLQVLDVAVCMTGLCLLAVPLSARINVKSELSEAVSGMYQAVADEIKAIKAT